MRSMIAAFEQLSHTVLPVIIGDRHKAGGENAQGRQSVAGRLRSLVPSPLWQTMRDSSLVRFDKTAGETLRRAVSEFLPDLIFERCNYMQISGVRVASQLGLPIVLEVNAPYVEERRALSGRSLLNRLALRREAEALRNATIVTVVSKALRDSLVAKHRIDRRKFVVLPNAVDSDLPRTDITDAQFLAEAKDGDPDRFVIAFVGSMFRWHGIDTLIRATALLIRAGRNVSLLLMGGTGSIGSELHELVNTYDMKDRVVFAGEVPHEMVHGYLRRSNAGAMASSNWYGSPVKIFEYALAGLPVIAPNNGPVRDVMEDGIHGYLVENSPESISSAIDTILMNPGEANVIASEFRTKVLREHTWRQNAERVLDAVAEDW